jgi:hypothetical protein
MLGVVLTVMLLVVVMDVEKRCLSSVPSYRDQTATPHFTRRPRRDVHRCLSQPRQPMHDTSEGCERAEQSLSLVTYLTMISRLPDGKRVAHVFLRTTSYELV